MLVPTSSYCELLQITVEVNCMTGISSRILLKIILMILFSFIKALKLFE